MKKVKILLFASLMMMAASCSTPKTLTGYKNIYKTHTMNLALVKDAQARKFVNLDYGIKVNITDGRSTEKASSIVFKHDNYSVVKPKVNVNPEVVPFVYESMRHYMRTLGFNLDADVATDYLMTVSLKEFNVNYLSGIGWSGVVNMEIEVFDSNRQLVYPNVSITGRSIKQGSGDDFTLANTVMNEAYVDALEDIDWDRIAFFLDVKQLPKDEPNKQVQGFGNTALEQTIIRWDVQSRPQGADIFWRVVSKTPEVKSTNNKYLQTTPYEATKALDIKGLTYQTSGNVRIVLRCEKDGYMPQEKEFDVRMVLDQEEISAFFRLVKDE